MAAAEFYAEAEVDIYGKTKFTRLTPEEDLEAQAKDIDARILLLQANIRGFLSRQRHTFSINMRHSVNGRHGEKPTRPRTGEGILETKRHFLQNLPGLGVSDNTDPGKDSQITNFGDIESRHTDATGDLSLRIGTKSPDLITLRPEELECK